MTKESLLKALEEERLKWGYDVGPSLALDAAITLVKEHLKEEWQPIETAPKNTKILIYYKNSLNKGRTIKASFIERWTVEHNGEDDHCEYNEARDCYYWPEGWYEDVDNWDDFASIMVDSANKPTHWMLLPLPPSTTPAKPGESEGV